MGIYKPPKASTGQLPKSVKVRSTCNACQQAKIRCSHEKPSCRRCQKHKIECIYSISRRLGRPAKKKENRAMGTESTFGLSDEVNINSAQTMIEQNPEKKVRKSGKKKACSQYTNTSHSCTSRHSEDLLDQREEQNMSKSTIEDFPGELEFKLYRYLFRIYLCSSIVQIKLQTYRRIRF